MRYCRRLDSSSRFRRGFTLVELVVALSLVAILVGLAAPTISETLERGEARSIARNAANTFRRARNQAMSRGEVVMARISDDDRGEIELFRTNNRATTCRSASTDTDDLTSVDILSITQSSGDMELEDVSPTVQWLCFAPDGRVFDSSAQIIRTGLANCEGMNFLLFLAHRDEEVEQSYKKCRSQSSVQSGQTDAKTLNRQKAHLWVVHVPYNGAISADQ